MLTEKQKKIITEAVYSVLKESMFESGDSNDNGENKVAKRESVLKWLRGMQVDLAPLAYKLAAATKGITNPNEIEKGTIRSEFYKKVDPDNHDYEFGDDEINMLYNMKDDFIDSIQ